MARYAQRREFNIPANYTEKREGPTKGTEIYLYTDAKGRPCAVGFRGRAQKATFHYVYKDEAQREENLKSWCESEARESAYKAERRAKRNAAHSLKVGDILVSSWGYEQTNVDFYQVVSLPSKCFVMLRKVATDIEQIRNLAMQGHATACVDDFRGEPFRKKPDGENCVKLSSYSFARPWDGKPRHVSWYA